jgi:hypothetical protein
VFKIKGVAFGTTFNNMVLPTSESGLSEGFKESGTGVLTFTGTPHLVRVTGSATVKQTDKTLRETSFQLYLNDIPVPNTLVSSVYYSVSVDLFLVSGATLEIKMRNTANELDNNIKVLTYNLTGVSIG